MIFNFCWYFEIEVIGRFGVKCIFLFMLMVLYYMFGKNVIFIIVNVNVDYFCYMNEKVFVEEFEKFL